MYKIHKSIHKVEAQYYNTLSAGIMPQIAEVAGLSSATQHT